MPRDEGELDAEEDNAGEDRNKKRRQQHRELQPIPQCGLGEGGGGDQLGKFYASRKMAWWLRDHGTTESTNMMPDHCSVRWMKNREAQLDFAQRFSTPLSENDEMRALSNDIGGPLEFEMNYTGKALHALVSTGRRSSIEKWRSSKVDAAFCAQFTTDRTRDILLDGGPEGGMQGIADLVLWKMSTESEVLHVDSNILKIASMFCEGQRAGGDVPVLWPAVATAWTAPRVSSAQNKFQEGGRCSMSCDLGALGDRMEFPLSQDIDEHLLDKITWFRGEEGLVPVDDDGQPLTRLMHDCEEIIPKQRRVNNPEIAGSSLDFEHASPRLMMPNGMFEVFVYQDIVHGLDDKGKPAVIKIDMLYIKAKFPAVEPVVALQQICNANARLSQPLLSVLKHMYGVMERQVHVTLDQAFSVGDVQNICSVACEAELPWAVFMFARQKGICNIHFGGFRIDVDDRANQEAWSMYINGVRASRKFHHEAVADAIFSHDLAHRSLAQAARPLEKFGLSLYHGFHYRSILLSDLDADIEFYLQHVEDAMREHRSSELQSWKAQLLKNRTHAFLVDGKPWARNTGVYIRLNQSGFEPFMGVKKRTAGSEFANSIVQPFKTMPFVSIYLRNRAQIIDPLNILWKSAYVIDELYMSKNINSLPLELLTIFQEMQTSVISGTTEYMIFENDVLQLFGNRRNDVIGSLRRIIKDAPLRDMAKIYHTVFNAGVNDALLLMRTGPLKQWSMAAISVFDLQRQGAQCGEAWFRDGQPFSRNLWTRSSTGAASGLLDDGVVFALYLTEMEERLDLDLCFCNRVFMDILTRVQIMKFSYASKAWGMTIKIADMAHTVDVIYKKKSAGGFFYDKTVVDWKSPGAGADALLNTQGEANNAYGRYLVMDASLRSFYESSRSRDIIAKHISPMALTQWLGSGVPFTSDGGQCHLDESATSYRELAGIMGHLTEMMKMNASSSGAADQLGNIEAVCNESGGGEGTRREPWTTSRGGLSVSTEKMLDLPLGVACSNRHIEGQPTSLFAGARMQSLASSTRDGEIGRLVVSAGSPNVSTASPINVSDPDSDRGQSDLGKRSRGGRTRNFTWKMIDDLQAEDRTPMRPVSEDMTRSNMIYFLLRHIWRKSMPFLHKTMTIGYNTFKYTHTLSFRDLGGFVRTMTNGLRRHYLKDDTAMNRTLNGPWETAGAYPMFAMQMSYQAVTRATRHAFRNANGDVAIAFEQVMTDIMAALMNVPISCLVILSSLHSFLFATVLDISTMILCSYMLFMMGVQRSCSMEVIALVMNGEKLNEGQQQQYNYLCSIILPACSDISSHNPSFIVPVKEGVLKMPTLEELLVWFYIGQGGNFTEVNNMKQKRHPPNDNWSVFVKPRYRFLESTRPEWHKRREAFNSKIPLQDQEDDYASGTPERIIASTFAAQQTEKRYDWTKESLKSTRSLEPFENPSVFWNAAHAGTRLCKTDNKKIDKHDLKFDPVWTTGHWYLETISNIGNCRGVVRAFFVLCNLHEKTTYEQFFTKLLLPYMQRNNIQCEIRKEGNWKNPVLENEENMFSWMSDPYVHNKVVKGVEVSLVMNVLFFVIAQALCAQEWNTEEKTADGTYVATVHLRNVAQMNLQLMSLLLHTHLEKAAIPANDGHVVLIHPSPFMKNFGQPAQIVFDSRLHVDSRYSNLPQSNSLCFRARLPNKWMICQLADHCRFATYTVVEKNNASGKTIDSLADVFPFPPESICHMQAHYEIMAVVYRRSAAQNGDPVHSLARGMMEYGFSVTSECVRHIPVALTHCTTHLNQEIPCVSYNDAYLFVLKIRRKCIEIVPVAPQYGHGFSALPLRGKTTVGMHQISDLMAGGLAHDDSDGVCVFLPDAEGKDPLPYDRPVPLPSYFFPVVMWPQLVLFGKGAKKVNFQTSDGASVDFEVLDLNNLFIELIEEDRDWDEQKVQQWLEGNPDLNVADASIRIFGEDDNPTFLVMDDTGEDVKFIFNSKLHLKYELERNGAFELKNTNKDDDFATCVLQKDGEFWHILKDESGVHYVETSSFEDMAQKRSGQLREFQQTLKAARDLEKNASASDSQKLVAARRIVTLQGQIKDLNAETVNVCAQTTTLKAPDGLFVWQDVVLPSCEFDDVLGIVMAHPETDVFLQEGMYHVEYLEQGEMQKVCVCNIDFVSMSMCHVAEGTNLFLLLDSDSLGDLSRLKLTLSPDCREQIGNCEQRAFLSVFYVLGGTAHDTGVEMSCINVLLEVAPTDNTSGTAKRELIRVRLYAENDSHKQIIFPYAGGDSVVIKCLSERTDRLRGESLVLWSANEHV